MYDQRHHLQTGAWHQQRDQILPAGQVHGYLSRTMRFHSRISAMVRATIKPSDAATTTDCKPGLNSSSPTGCNSLAAYTWSKTFPMRGDLLNGGSVKGYRAPDVPGYGSRFRSGPADFDIRNVFHLSGYYELPFGKDKRFLANSGKIENAVVGGWAANTISYPSGWSTDHVSVAQPAPPREQTVTTSRFRARARSWACTKTPTES